ncbi:AMP-binding protein [Novosphingobium colocasiae]
MGAHARRTAPPSLPGGTARISFTSGSTGTPKGLCLSAEHMLTVARSVVDAVGSEHAGRHLAVLPPGILLETIAGFFATMLAGGTWVCPAQAQIGLADPFRPDFGRMLEVIAAQRITSLILVPEYLAGLVAVLSASGSRLPDLTLVAVGGAHVPPALIARARDVGLPVRQGYGLTECASVVSLERGAGDPPGSVGPPLGHVRAHVAADGEIVLEGPMFLGTVGEPRAPGPLHTGDVGKIDDEGRIWLSGRKSNQLVTSFGRNVSPEWVEAALLAQPDIAQAMVHGDGRPSPEALIVPAQPQADIANAVAAANATLPAYAQVAAWREVAHFTPLNGMLTGNGRLRRKAIAAALLDREPAFIHQLEAATVRQRLTFLAIPQVRAGLAGAIGLQTYRDYLAQAWHHVRHTVPLLKAARARLSHRADLAHALDAYIVEEDGHDEWILADIRAAGGDADSVRASRPAPATAAMVAHAYDRIDNGNPVSFFGMVYVLESVSVALAQRGASAVAERLGLPPQAFTYLTSHGALDLDHMHFFTDLVNRLDDPGDRAAIIGMAQDMFCLFGNVFASIDLEALDVAA